MKNGTFIAAFVVLLISGGIAAQDADVAPDVEIDETAGQFPRVWTNDAGSVIVHAPEIEAWPDFAIVLARAAIEVTLNEESAPTLGTIQFTASTETNLDLRLIALDDIVLTEIGFSGSLTAERNAQLEEFVTATLPLAPTEVPVEVVLSYISSDTTLPTIEGLQMEPPPIFYSSTPAVLVQTDGDPLFAPIEDTRLEFIVNTNWDLFHYRDREWYLLNEEHWLTSDELTGPWEYDRRLPNDFDDLPADGNFSSARRAIPAERTDEDAPNVFYSDRPAELIVIAGAETRVPIGGPGLGYVSNTSSDLFVHLDQYYFLASGRWFTADQLRGPWTQAPTLPEAFASIPADHPDKGRIRASVPGTDEARLAALEALIPRRAVVSRDAGANVIVNYYGEPEFEVIFGTTVSRAVNSPNDVLLADGRYYLCLNAVWYASSVPDGPWAVADTIPTAVYTIPASSPVYHVTNVHVYESDEDTVSTGFTGGYTGLYVSYGIAIYGTGWYYPSYYYYDPFYPYPYYYPYPYSYGAASWYNPNTGMYGRSGSVYGPYGGYGRGSSYNPQTGAFARGEAIWDNDEIAGSAYGYNPRTGTGVATNRYATEYGGWGETLITNDDRWLYTEGQWTENTRATQFEGSGGATGEIRTEIRGDVLTREADIERRDQSLSTRSVRSERGGAIGVETGEGARGALARDAETGDLYAGRDGDVYRRSEDGWSQHDGEAWQPIDVPVERQQQIEQARSGAQDRLSSAQQPGGDTRSRLQESVASRDADRSRSSLSSANRSRDFDRRQDLNRSFNARSGGFNRFNNARSARGGGGRVRRR